MAEVERVVDENGESQIKVDTHMIKCPSCGGNMVFDAENQKLHCEHCDTLVDIGEKFLANERAIVDGFTSDNKWATDEASVFSCDNCGAKVVLQKDQTATSCPFCGTNHVTKTEELSGLKPNAVLPFQFDVDSAINYSKTWARKKFFAPSRFKKNISTDKVHGVYAPCFTFDSHTTTIYSARLGTRHTRVVGSGKNRRVETYIVWRNVSGTHNSMFDDVLISAGSKLDQKTLQKLMPYNSNSSLNYDEKYLLGFMAYHYDSELETCWGDAKVIMDSCIKTDILKGYNYDVVDYFNMSTTHQNVTYKYAMLPVYVGNFNYNKKVYNFYVNGETGKVTGKTPVSFWRVFCTALGITAVIALIVLFIIMWQNT